MGRGDRRSKKGKIARGSHGNSRPKTKNIEPKVKYTEKPKQKEKENA